MSETATALPDTDWCVPDLYDFVTVPGVTTLIANYSRYVVDLNRPVDDTALYGNYASTSVCPTATFFGESIYRAGCEPTAREIEKRIARYWDPYHRTLGKLVQSNVQKFGLAVIYDAHSIAPAIPGLFEGELPVLNLGTSNGNACGREFEEPVSHAVSASGFTHAVNGRFVGGYITRHYGQPEQGRHAMQMEISQRAYLNEREQVVDATLARPLRKVLSEIFRVLTDSVNRSVAKRTTR